MCKTSTNQRPGFQLQLTPNTVHDPDPKCFLQRGSYYTWISNNMVWETSNISIQFILTLILTLRYRLGKSRCRRSIWDGNLLKSTSCFICRRYILFHTKVVKVEMKVNQLDSLDLKMVIIEFGMCLLRILLTQRANDSDWSVGGRKHDGLNLNS